jgi:hypothetical protein
MTKDEKAKLYMEYLAQEGYRPSINSDGDVVFKAEGLTHRILIDEKDEEYFSMVIFIIWEIENSEDLPRAVRAANAATRDTKVAKLHVDETGKYVTASLEMYVSPPENFAHTCNRCIHTLKYAVDKFVQQMSSDQPIAALR